MTKRTWIVFLVGVNLLLLVCLIITTFSPPEAAAQAVSRRGEFILVSARAEVDNDVIYLLDLATRQIHAFRARLPRSADDPIMVRWLNSRDLVRDFR